MAKLPFFMALKIALTFEEGHWTQHPIFATAVGRMMLNGIGSCCSPRCKTFWSASDTWYQFWSASLNNQRHLHISNLQCHIIYIKSYFKIVGWFVLDTYYRCSINVFQKRQDELQSYKCFKMHVTKTDL